VQPLAESRTSRLLVLGALYLAQGVPWGFMGVGYVLFLTDRGLDNAAIGDAVGLAYLPWSFKLLAGPPLDRAPATRLGRRTPFIVGAQLAMALSLLALGAVDASAHLRLASAILFVHNAFAALQDVATDALAVDVLPADERGRANSVMWASKSAGVALGGGGGTLVAKHLGWPALFGLIATLLGAVMVLVIAAREGRGDVARAPAAPPRAPFAWRTLRRSFGFREPLVGLAVAMLVPVGYSLVGTVMTRLLRADLGFSPERIALLTGTIDPVTGIAGALAGGALADRFGARRVMAACIATLGVGLVAFAGARGIWPQFVFVAAWSVPMTFALHAYGSASLGMFMGLSNPAIGATQFAAYMAAVNLTYAWTHPVGGRLADALGPAVTFAVAGAAQLASLALIPFVDPARAEARFRAENDDPAAA
jgi:PAT family beta-lactamase induction signal transducer AmpG